jgi:hypothetical protein
VSVSAKAGTDTTTRTVSGSREVRGINIG